MNITIYILNWFRGYTASDEEYFENVRKNIETITKKVPN